MLRNNSGLPLCCVRVCVCLVCVCLCSSTHACLTQPVCMFVSCSSSVCNSMYLLVHVHSVCTRREGPQCKWVTLLGPLIPCLDQIYSLGFHSSCSAKLMATSINDLTAAFGHWPAEPGPHGQSHAAPVTYSQPAAVLIGGGRRD